MRIYVHIAVQITKKKRNSFVCNEGVLFVNSRKKMFIQNKYKSSEKESIYKYTKILLRSKSSYINKKNISILPSASIEIYTYKRMH